MSKKFDEFFDWRNGMEYWGIVQGWDTCKKEILEILNKYSNSPDIKYIKEEIEKL